MEQKPEQKPDEAGRNLTSTLQDMTKSAFQAQADLSEAMVSALTSIQGMPKPAVEAVQRFHEMSKKLRATQASMFDSYFSVVKKFDPTGALGSLTGKTAAPIQMVQEIARKAVKAQVDLIKTFGGMLSGVVGTVTGKKKDAKKP